MRLHFLTTLPILLVLLLGLSSSLMAQQVVTDPSVAQPVGGSANPTVSDTVAAPVSQGNGGSQASQTVLASPGKEAAANGTNPGSGKNQDEETYWTVGILTTLGVSLLLISVIVQGVSWLSSIGVNVPITPKQKKA
ncbi:MAG: hypothetical protein DHS80DRAFT_22520 [Piptocephalis tieghemiana]|nr:MAG: hypothetical protein DHS80DRAFT_22520 [Piptocephalis tieghemiana]